ncbi:MAG: hypothetical protein MUE50_22615, partial [Pirellulaceae bacterium]|nr:hypothetical protein [Pirellulaceae bacterium]
MGFAFGLVEFARSPTITRSASEERARCRIASFTLRVTLSPADAWLSKARAEFLHIGNPSEARLLTDTTSTLDHTNFEKNAGGIVRFGVAAAHSILMRFLPLASHFNEVFENAFDSSA